VTEARCERINGGSFQFELIPTRLNARPGGSRYDDETMDCAIITPIGPGHERLFEECKRSVEAAIAHSTGPFSSVVHRPIDDTAGTMGRSRARNSEVIRAVDAGADWIFFLDADDLLLEDVFENVREAVLQCDAIWGAICEQKRGPSTRQIRDQPNIPVRTIQDVLRLDPFFSLQMGRFVRGQIAKETPFNERPNTGEDFDYYLRVWLGRRCVKLHIPRFVNRREMHSKGPKSGSGGGDEWLYEVFRCRFIHGCPGANVAWGRYPRRRPRGFSLAPFSCRTYAPWGRPLFPHGAMTGRPC
jgi:hypothetical protein